MKIEKELQRVLAIEVLRAYCTDNKLSIEKLKKERFEFSYDECGFFHPSEIVPQGLVNDMETMPKPTLIIKNEEGYLKIEKTQYTKQFLGI